MACVGLGVKPPVGRVSIFRLTPVAHLKMLHGGIGPIIWDILNNGIAGPAVRAVDKGVPVAEIVGGKELLQTIIADGDIG